MIRGNDDWSLGAMARVLLTGARAPATLELARCFARAGHTVFTADSVVNLTSVSNAVTKAFSVSKPRLEPIKFARELLSIAQLERVDLIVPTCEEVFWLQLAAARTEFAGLPVFAPEIKILHTLHHKWRFHQLLESLGIATPETRLLQTQQDLDALPSSTRWILKPAYSRFAGQTRLRSEMKERPRITRAQPWLAQEFIAGQECCVFAVAKSGRLTAFTLYGAGWRAGRGASVSFARVQTGDPRFLEALGIATRLAAQLGLTGQFGLDLIATPTGWSVLECNPRATSGAHLFAPTDQLERAYFEDLATPIIASGRAAKLGVPMLMYALPSILEPDKLNTWRSAWNDSRDVLRDSRDPLPVTQTLRVLSSNFREAIRLRCSLIAVTTRDLEWNGEALEAEPLALESAWTALIAESRARSTKAFAENLDCELTLLRVGSLELPMTIARAGLGNAYVVSMRTHYVNYALDELRELGNPWLEAVLRVALNALGAVLDFGRVDDINIVGNALFSTNLHPALSLEQLTQITCSLTSLHPRSAVAFRSVHGRDSRLPEFLRELGYRLIPARSVTFVPTRGVGFQRKRDVRQDAKLLENGAYTVRRIAQLSAAECQRIAVLYDSLYIQKYSAHNPRFTPALIETAARTQLLEFIALEREDGTANGRMDGVIGFYAQHGYLTVPILGYDTALPAQTGLYRMLSSIIADEAHKRDLDLHASSGVNRFKRSRGGEAELEYIAVFDAHLPLKTRAAWAILEGLMTWVAVPLLKARGL